jgi:type II secretion system protein N
MSDAQLIAEATTDANLVIAPPETRLKRTLRITGWVSLFTTCLILFTILKLPEVRLKNFVQGNLAAMLATRGITFTAAKSSVSIGFGVSYSMKDVTLNLPPPELPVKIDEIEVAPRLLPMLLGRTGAKFWVYHGDGKLKGTVSMKGNNVWLDASAKNLDFGKLGILSMAAGIHGKGTLSGSISLSGDLNSPATLSGDADLDLKGIVLDPQTIQGFAIPRLSISEGKIEAEAKEGKGAIKTVKLGKKGEAKDDIVATAGGEMLLGKQWETSSMNLKTQFALSEQVIKSFGSIVDLLLKEGKQPDGSYSYTLSGPINSLTPTPVKAP